MLHMIKYKKTYQFTTKCKSDQDTHPKQHKSLLWDNVIERSHCIYNPLDMAPFNFCTSSLSHVADRIDFSSYPKFQSSLQHCVLTVS